MKMALYIFQMATATSTPVQYLWAKKLKEIKNLMKQQGTLLVIVTCFHVLMDLQVQIHCMKIILPYILTVLVRMLSVFWFIMSCGIIKTEIGISFHMCFIKHYKSWSVLFEGEATDKGFNIHGKLGTASALSTLLVLQQSVKLYTNLSKCTLSGFCWCMLQ